MGPEGRCKRVFITKKRPLTLSRNEVQRPPKCRHHAYGAAEHCITRYNFVVGCTTRSCSRETSRTVDPEREVKRSGQKARSMKETIESADIAGICDVCRLSACHPLKMQYPAWSARSSLEIFRTFECEVEIMLHTDNESLHKHASATLTTGNVVFIAVHQTGVPLCL